MKLASTTAAYVALLLWATNGTSCWALIPTSNGRAPPRAFHASTTLDAPPIPIISSDASISATTNDDDSTLPSTIQFPPPLNAFDRMKRALAFWLSVAPIAASYYGKMVELKAREALQGMAMTDEEVQEHWERLHEDGSQKLTDAIADMKGFYVKAGQIMSTRGDLFPKQYVEKLNAFTDSLDPMPIGMVREIIKRELLKDGDRFADVFSEFDDEPLGAASIAQVHRAVLTEKYGGPKEVAVKIQRPSIESKLMGDVANLKLISKLAKDADISPVDYYTVFSELEEQLQDEFNFLLEASAMETIYQNVVTSHDGMQQADHDMVMPKPVEGLVSRRVLVMDFLRGIPLSRSQKVMRENGIDPNSAPAKLMGKKLVASLTHVFGRSILNTGLFHADPHPGNVFVLDDGGIGLIDFGQVKQLSDDYRSTIAKILVVLDEREGDDQLRDMQKLEELVRDLGVVFKEDAKPEAAAAFAMWLFDGSVEKLPGGYDVRELSPNAPVKDIKTFPQDLVLVARSAVLIKALSNRFGIRWSLAKEWAPIARQNLYGVPIGSSATQQQQHGNRFGDLRVRLKSTIKRRGRSVMKRLPARVRSRIASWLV